MVANLGDLMRKARLLSVLIACVVAVVSASCSSSGSSSSSSANASTSEAMARTRAAGLQPLKAEALAYHIHSHLDVFKNGAPVVVPQYIGIDAQSDCSTPCISPLHTHDTSGIVHVESPEKKDYTLAQFLTEWGMTLDPGAVIYVDGARVPGGPDTVVLRDGEEIAIVMGTPPATIPSKYAGF